MVSKPNQIYTEFEFAHLSGKLIIFGAVDASACDNSGLNKDGTATDCGIKAAQGVSNEFQNRFNSAIIRTSKQQNIPPRLLKNIFAYESQFWPETVFKTKFEYGLGHITLDGADSALRWDTDLYQEICTSAFSKENCQTEYGYQPENFRNSLQGVLVQKLNANCSTCRFNLDFNYAEKSIPYIGKTLLANAAYVRYAVKIFTGRSAEEMVSSDDIWRFILVAYNAGPGCYRSALSSAYYRGLALTWSNLKNYLEPACKGAIPYVEFISKTDAYHPDDDPALHPTETPETPPTPTPLPPVSLEAPHSDTELVVKVDAEHLDNALKTLKDLGVASDQLGKPIDVLGDRVVQIPTEKYKDILEALRASPDFAMAEPNYLVAMAAIPSAYPDDPLYASQPNLTTIQVPTAWTTLNIDGTPGNPGSPVTVAVVDSGVDASHLDLAGKFFTNPGETNCTDGIDDDHNGFVDDCNGWDFTNRDKNPADDNGHGTEMAGVIGAVTNNTIGIAGIAPNARILPIKVLYSYGMGTHSMAAEGIIYAANMGARVIYLGFASSASSQILSNAVTYAVSKGALIVAPAGNDNGLPVDNYPASYPGVLSVSAITNSGTIAAFSTSSMNISLAAPGENIISTARGNTYLTTSGTSLAAAHVAGVATMLAGQPQFLNHLDLLRSALITSALDAGPAGRDALYGYGIVRANNAITAVVPTVKVQITTPGSSSVFTMGQSITFTGTALDNTNNNVASTLAWTSNIDGHIGDGATFSTSRLTPGAHTITASTVGGSASLEIRVVEVNGPHGSYSTDTEACITCHNTHSEKDTQALSATVSNTFCNNCHNGNRAKAVSTHGNVASDAGFLKQEQNFELLCIQCHDPHAGSGNIFAVRKNFVLGALPARFQSMVVQSNIDITFNALDPLTSPNTLTNLCVACHGDSRNPGFPMASHDGGDHPVPIEDATGEICLQCHYHDLDGKPSTSDGFMPYYPIPLTNRQGLTPTAQVGGTQTPTPTATDEGLIPTRIPAKTIIPILPTVFDNPPVSH